MTEQFLFEQLCIRKIRGYAFDLDSTFQPHNPGTFDEITVKITSKVEASVMMLETHNSPLSKFSVIAFPYSEEVSAKGGRRQLKKKSDQDCVSETWNILSNDDWDGLQIISVLTQDSIPVSVTREHSVLEFTSSLMDCMKAYFLFQNPKDPYVTSAITSWENKDPDMVFIALVWTLGPQPRTTPVSSPFVVSKPQHVERLERPVFPQQKSVQRGRVARQEEEQEESSDDEVTFKDSSPKKESKWQSLHIPAEANMSRQVTRTKTVRSSTKRSVVNNNLEADNEEMDTSLHSRSLTRKREISEEPTINESRKRRRAFEVIEEEPMEIPERTRVVTTSVRNTTRRRVVEGDPEEEEVVVPSRGRKSGVSLPVQPLTDVDMNDVTLGFEMNPTTPSRKSVARKSMGVADWPEEEKEQILDLFDNLNPSMSEQTKIALTCKYVYVQFEKELTSKILYIWIQKKGRKVHKKDQSFQLSEEDQKATVMDFFRSLNPSHSQTTKTAFTIKYFQAQYGVKITSKQLLSWINEKPTKKAGRRR